MKRKSIYDEYMAIIMQDGGHYEIHRWNADKPLIAFKKRGHRYVVRKEKAMTLKGWYPWTQIRFFQSIMDALSHWVNGIGLLIYDESADANAEGYIEPLDRIQDGVKAPGAADILSPYLHRVIGESVLYRDAMKKLSFGGGMSWKTGTILLAAMLFLMLVLYLGGYFE